MLNEKTAQKIFNKYDLGKVDSINNEATGITGTVFELNNKFIIKLQNDATDTVRSERNALICNILKENNIKAPLLIALDISQEIIPEKYIITTKLEGDNVRDIWEDLPKDEQKRIFFEYGKLMAEFHQIKLKKFGDPADKNHQFDDWYDCIISRYKKYYSYIKKHNILSEEILSGINKFFVKNDGLLQIKTNPVLVHNDFQAKNIKYYQG